MSPSHCCRCANTFDADAALNWPAWQLYARCSCRNWNSAQTRYTLVGMRLLREADAAGDW